MLQVPDYRRLTVRSTFHTAVADTDRNVLRGLCAVGGSHIVTVEGDNKYRICLYEVTPKKLKLRDKHLELEVASNPRADSRGTVYVPYQGGVAVIDVKDGKHLHLVRTISAIRYTHQLGGLVTQLRSVHSVAVENDRTLWVTVDHGVYRVDVTSESVTAILDLGEALQHRQLDGIAFLSGSVLVGCSPSSTLALYPPDKSTPTLLQPEGLKLTRGITVDQDGHFLVADERGNKIWILSATGEVIDTVAAETPCDVTVMADHGHLYVANYWASQVTIMSAQ